MMQENGNSAKLPPEIEQHLHKLVASISTDNPEELYNRLRVAWTEKERLFSEQTALLNMTEAGEVAPDDGRGMLIFTNSGSLLSIAPLREGERWIEYASIPLRADVPEILKGSGVTLPSGATRGAPLELENAPLKKSSPVYRIAISPEGTSPAEQEKRIREATIFLTNGFARINKNAASFDTGEVEHFTKSTMVSYVAKRNDLTQKAVRQVIDDYLSVVESGMLLGEKVPLGNLGRVGLRVKPAQKARVGRNPATGEEITIAAKPPRAVPKMFFSSAAKERAGQVDTESLQADKDASGEDEAGSPEEEES